MTVLIEVATWSNLRGAVQYCTFKVHMTTRSILLSGGNHSTRLLLTCNARLGAETYHATQYCSHVDSLAAEILTHVEPYGPIVLVYTSFTDVASLEALLYVVQRVVEAQRHEFWTGTAESWQLQLSETPEECCSQNHDSDAADGSTGVFTAGFNSVPVSYVRQFELESVTHCLLQPQLLQEASLTLSVRCAQIIFTDTYEDSSGAHDSRLPAASHTVSLLMSCSQYKKHRANIKSCPAAPWQTISEQHRKKSRPHF